jgi:hypothetical protein
MEERLLFSNREDKLLAASLAICSRKVRAGRHFQSQHTTRPLVAVR